jgi:hypothetical protein
VRAQPAASSRRAAEKRDELAPPDAKCHLTPSSLKGYLRIPPLSVRVRPHIRQHRPIGIRWTAS